jgi:hypothetical protein
MAKAKNSSKADAPGEVRSLAELHPDPENARRHTPRGVGLIEDSLQECGAGRSLLIDEANMLIAGHATVEAAGNVGIEKVRIIDVAGDELVALRRSNLSPAQKRRLALFDNRTAEFAEWEPEVLARMLADGEDLTKFWTDDELDILRHAEFRPAEQEPLEEPPANAHLHPVYFTPEQRAVVDAAIEKCRELHEGVDEAEAIVIICMGYEGV